MSKKAVFGAFLLCIELGVLHAQHKAISPYSSYGYGARRYDSDAVTSAMGGVGVNFSDALHINMSNPAANARLQLTTYQLGINAVGAVFRTHSDSNVQSATYVGQAALALPLGRSALLFGFSPFSAVGYSLRTSPAGDAEGFIEHSAMGGLNSFLVGYAYRIAEHFSLGVHASYLFGNVEKHLISAQKQVEFRSDQWEIRRTAGFYFKGGALYTLPLKRDEKIQIGAAYSVGGPMRTNTDKLVYSFQYAGDGSGRKLPRDTVLDQRGLSGTMDLPDCLRFAIGLDKNLHFGYGIQFDFERFQAFEVDGEKDPNLSNALRFAAGGYWIPDYDAFQHYFSRVTYRFGAFYENTAVQIRAQRIRDFGLTLGLQLPLGRSAPSNLNLALILGRRGTRVQNLIQENYLNLRICFSFNDKWFRKREYD